MRFMWLAPVLLLAACSGGDDAPKKPSEMNRSDFDKMEKEARDKSEEMRNELEKRSNNY